MKRTFRFGLPLLAGLLMLPIPLLGDFHIESALLVSLAGCFWAGWKGATLKGGQTDTKNLLFIYTSIYLAGVPLFVYALVMGCLGIHGVGYWVLYPVPGVLFGYSLGRLLRRCGVPFRRLLTMTALFLVAVGIFLFEFFSFPQVYFFNHVWGGWPGPIYDETVTLGWSLVFYRALTMGWAGLFWYLPAFYRNRKAKLVVLGCLVGLGAGYSQLPEMGIITPRRYLQQQLGGHKATPHFAIYYDRDHYTPDEIGFIAQKQEFYFRQIAEGLDIGWNDRTPAIESYLYAHPWQKKKLVGAKFTSYVPVWLDRDQLHIARGQIEGSLKHELVHVLSKQFGNRLFNASWSIGLTEGVAVALAPEVSSLSTVNQIVASEKPYPSAGEMAHSLSPLGFYGGRSGVNYTQTGSFVQYLLESYPVEQFKEAYPCGDIEEAYPVSFDSLVAGWHGVLDTVRVDSTDRRVAEQLYGFPSLFEQACPHVQSDFARLWDRYRYQMAEKDTAGALGYLQRARDIAPGNLYLKNRWAYLSLKRGRGNAVRRQSSRADSTIEGMLLYADAAMQQHDAAAAQQFLERAGQMLAKSANEDPHLRAAWQMRRDGAQWRWYRRIVYGGETVADSVFSGLAHRVQMRAIRQAMRRQRGEQMIRYAELASTGRPDSLYFEVYVDLIEHLAYYENTMLARRWIDKVASMPLRERQRRQLQELRAWVRFLTQRR